MWASVLFDRTGAENLPNGQNGVFYEKEGKQIKFKNVSDMFTYLSKRGWIYVDHVKQNNFLFRKQVKSDEEIKEGLCFKEDFKKKKGSE